MGVSEEEHRTLLAASLAAVDRQLAEIFRRLGIAETKVDALRTAVANSDSRWLLVEKALAAVASTSQLASEQAHTALTIIKEAVFRPELLHTEEKRDGTSAAPQNPADSGEPGGEGT